MKPPPSLSARICSSLLAPVVLLAIFLGGGAHQQPTAAKGSARAHTSKGKHLARVIPVERPDGAPAPKSKPKPKPAPAPAAVPAKHSVFSGLGAWIDLYDTLPIGPTIVTLKGNGVQTLYLQTGRSDTRYAVQPAAIPWLVAAHRAGIKVVGWYLPYYVGIRYDVARMISIARFQYGHDRFDGVGIDIEYKGAQRNNNKWNRYVVAQLKGVRAALGSGYPLGSIPPPPLQMRLAPKFWHGFPWKSLGRYSSEIMLMSYWSPRTGCPRIRMECAYEYTKYNVLVTRQLAGSGVPIHIIGGIGDAISTNELLRFIQGAADAKADGASIYDIATTKGAWWRPLQQLRTLGS
jgi:hypothetical protein